MTTNILLTLIAVLLAARIILQLRNGKRAFYNCYCKASDVECRFDCTNNLFEISDIATKHGKDGWEIVTILSTETPSGKGYIIFFTRKKIKNYYEK